MKKQKSNVVLVTYANQTFIKSAKALEKRAKSVGFSDIRVFGPNDLTPEFIAKNKETLAFPKGAGYWVWKPEIIANALNSMDDNQPLLYCDAGAMLRLQAKYFENLSQDGLIHIWSLPSHKGSNDFWIDQQVWDEIVGVSEVNQDAHYWAGLILGKNNDVFRNLIGNWLSLCQKEQLLRPDSKEQYAPSPGLIWHRHDQSILNCLVHLDTSHFNLHSFDSEPKKSPVIVHRRGNIKYFTQVLLIVLLGKLYRWFVSFFPKPIRKYIFKNITRYRRPYASNKEIDRHINQFFD